MVCGRLDTHIDDDTENKLELKPTGLFTLQKYKGTSIVEYYLNKKS